MKVIPHKIFEMLKVMKEHLKETHPDLEIRVEIMDGMEYVEREMKREREKPRSSTIG